MVEFALRYRACEFGSVRTSVANRTLRQRWICGVAWLASWSPGLTSLRRCAMLPASRSWRTGHVDHLACLPDRVHGLHNVRRRCIGERFDFDARSGPLEILRDGDRTDIWRP